MMKRKSVIGIALAACALSAGYAFGSLHVGPGTTPFWIGLSSPQQIDLQVARLLANHAVVIALNMPDIGDPQGTSGVRATVGKLKREAPQTPILMDTYASRNMRNLVGTGSAAVLDWIDKDGDMRLSTPSGQPLKGFGDVTREDYRAKVASTNAAAVNRGGFDGIVVDLAIRTPRYTGAAVDRMCIVDDAFCARYSEGMDATFDAMRNALGDRPIMYNGLWNLGPAMIADQQKLLLHTDAATVEFFGGDPRKPEHSFSHDVLPYIKAMAQVPGDKKLMVFGRGSWQYTDYAQDYAQQRYLYCSFLLGVRANTYFKYLATFQVDAPTGRAQGLSIYADWAANVGAPVKAYSLENGLYSRPFAHGLVVVAPDDGDGGGYDLPHAMYSPEGEKYEGHVRLQPGEGLLLLDDQQSIASDRSLLDLKLLADWPKASPLSDTAGSVISLQAGAAVGSHDMLLDVVRSSHPSNMLQLEAMAEGESPQIQVVAEVDDSSKQHEFAILNIEVKGDTTTSRNGVAMSFRSPSNGKTNLPVIDSPQLTPGVWQTLKLDGHAVFAGSTLTFKRWDYVRFDGAMKLRSVKLIN